MLSFTGQAVLLDIEGTVAPIAYVFDVMFPYVRRELRAFLSARMASEEVAAAAEGIAQDAGFASFDELFHRERESSYEIDRATALAREVERQMDADRKWTGLKSLQGLIWKSGFESGELVAETFEDVPSVLHTWHAAGRDVRIYSSGSVGAQKMFFGHTQAGDLLPTLRGHFDTSVGGKKEAASYVRVASDMGLPAQSILFVSDVPEELFAAREAGMAVALAVRPGNPPIDERQAAELPRIGSLREIEWTP